MWGEVYKRPLYPPIFIVFNWTLSHLGLDYPARMYAVLSLFASLCGVLMCTLLLKTNLSPLQSVLGSLICTFSFSWLSVFSIPESYSLTVAGAILCLISGRRFVGIDQVPPTLSLQHAIVVGVASWLYLPLYGASLLVLSALDQRKQWVTVLVPVLVVALIIAVAPQFLSDLGGLSKQWSYGARHSSLDNLMSVESWRDVSMGFLFFSFVAPARDFVASTGRPDWGYIMSNWPTIVAVVVIAAAYCFLLWRAISQGLTRASIGVTAWLGSLLVFYVVYDPKVVLLYASLPAALIVYCGGVVLGHDKEWRIADPSRRGLALVAMALMGILLLGFNLPAILGL